MDIRNQAVNRPPEAPLDPGSLAFASVFTPNIFVADYDPEGGWHDARIEPLADFPMHPASLVLHYGQEIFEGLKAYRHGDGSIHMFRPERNAARMNRSAARMRMPEYAVEDQVAAMIAAINTVRDWVPREPGTLYVRPTMIATEAGLGVRPSKTYRYFILTAASGPYFQVSGRTLRIWVERQFVRAAPGGTGAAKTGGNYAGSLLAGARAAEKSCDQVMWLDAQERRYVEECGAMNLMFVLDGVVTTPPTSGTILEGVTRESVAMLCRDEGIPFAERPVAVEELIAAIQSGRCTEMFSCGTAAVLTPIGYLVDGDDEYRIADGSPGPVGQRLYTTLTDMQFGRASDRFSWLVKV